METDVNLLNCWQTKYTIQWAMIYLVDSVINLSDWELRKDLRKIKQINYFFANKHPLSNLAFTRPRKHKSKHKMRSEDFSTTWKKLFSILLGQSENFSVFCKVFSQIASHNIMIVALPKSQKCHPARARAPLSLPHKFFDVTNFCKIRPLLPVVITKSC